MTIKELRQNFTEDFENIIEGYFQNPSTLDIEILRYIEYLENEIVELDDALQESIMENI